MRRCRRWRESTLWQGPDMPPLAAMILSARGLNTPQAAHRYLDCSCPLDDPFLLTDMDLAAGRVGLAMAKGEKIAVFGDYDVDGITATCLLTDFLRSWGCDCVPYIPGRLEEGYGLNPMAIRQLHDQGVNLIVTVDCGITAMEEAELCRSLGMDLVITDHHECKGTLPQAVAVVDPPPSRRGVSPQEPLRGGCGLQAGCRPFRQSGGHPGPVRRHGVPGHRGRRDAPYGREPGVCEPGAFHAPPQSPSRHCRPHGRGRLSAGADERLLCGVCAGSQNQRRRTDGQHPRGGGAVPYPGPGQSPGAGGGAVPDEPGAAERGIGDLRPGGADAPPGGCPCRHCAGGGELAPGCGGHRGQPDCGGIRLPHLPHLSGWGQRESQLPELRGL